jgi:rod shape-determining protein MreC
MVVSSGHQSAIFAYSSNQLGGQAFNSWASITHYFHLAEANQQLTEENTYLRGQIKNSFLDRDTYIFDDIETPADSSNHDLRNDTLSPSFDYLSAKVISNSVHKQKNYLMLNKGRKHGINENMGVIGTNGCVGIVYSVSEDFCTVVSLLNTKTRISVKLASNQELGSLHWDGVDAQYAQLKSIETYIPIQIGDTIISSGYSHIFPEGIPVGIIDDFHTTTKKNTYEISVKLSTNFSTLNYVSIIRNRYYEEQLLLEKLEEDKL